MKFYHCPIMLNEILSGLSINPDGIYLDCTIGGAGHSLEILKRLSSKGKLIGIDKDADAIKECENKLKNFSNKILIHNDFKNIEEIFSNLNLTEIDGVLIDLGVSSYQLDDGDRGFSFRFDAKLDMRMDQTQNISAYDIVNSYSQQQLTKIFYEYGEEKYSASVAKKIVEKRKIKPIETTFQLRDIIESVMPQKYIYQSGGASKKIFQAIRIEVNGELEKLYESITFLINHLKQGGKMAILSFHSLEDRIVKNAFKDMARDCICPPKTPICICGHKASIRIINKKPTVATIQEQKENPRSSCAKLRIIEKI